MAPCFPGPSLPLCFVLTWFIKEAEANLASPLRQGQLKPPKIT